ncbi:SCO7613 C-terminal domain-containing membrane protein [Streptomyces sp. NPDC001373]|uniref:SCO7613 C-terminal domain-containing membrane protein n=1 Tax=Streptomyces sp. NPDC001373 TaxID=3364565 RepID=UPI0036BDAD42
MDTPLPPARELALIDAELARLDARRLHLLARRDWLLRLLWPSGPMPAGTAAGAQAWGTAAGAFGPPAAPFTPAGGLPAAPAPRTAAAKPGAQNVLLVLGAVLLAVAALAFTLVSWGSLGIGGRGAVLGVVTAAALAAPLALVRRGLRSTAEAVAGVALALTVLDAYALHAVALPDGGGTAFAAWAAAALAGLWAGHGAVVRGLRTAPLAAVGAGQLPLPLAAAAAGADLTGTGWALLATAALDAVLAVAVARRAVRVAAWGCAGALGGSAMAAGLAGSLVEPGAAGPALLLAAGALLGVAVAWREPRASAAAVAGGLAAVAAVGALVPAGSGSVWWPVAVRVAAGLALVAAVRAGRLPQPVRRGLARAGAGVAALAALAGLPAVLWLLVSRPASAGGDWAAAGPRAEGPGAGLAVVLLLAAGVFGLLPRVRPAEPAASAAAHGNSGALPGAAGGLHGAGPSGGAPGQPEQATTTGGPGGTGPRRDAPALPEREAATGSPGGTGPRRDAPGLTGREAPAVGVVCGWAGLFAASAGAGLPVAAVLVAQLALVVAAGAVALRAAEPAVAWAAGGCAAVGAFGVSLAALDGRTATVAVSVALGTAAALGAAYGGARAALRGAGAVGAVGYAAATVVALGASAGVAPAWTGVGVLAVAAAVVALGPRLGAVRVPAEVAAAGAGLLALALTVGDAPVSALALGLGGAVCAAGALRADRRGLGRAAGPLGVAAVWVRLGASGVAVPEAYALPVTALALAVGLVRRRRDPRASSWAAYGPGLAATLLPSLAAVWGDPYWPRPLLLGLGALAVTLAGAHRRLQAPLLLGAVVLAGVAVHELAPYVVQVAGLLPRWVPPALAGLLLLAVGATYESRLREARRLRAALGRLR